MRKKGPLVRVLCFHDVADAQWFGEQREREALRRAWELLHDPLRPRVGRPRAHAGFRPAGALP